MRASSTAEPVRERRVPHSCFAAAPSLRPAITLSRYGQSDQRLSQAPAKSIGPDL